jgi:O-antigen/teichoic acid export membrane protein
MVDFGKELKTLLRHGATYGFGDLLSRVIGFLMIPVYTHYLKTSDYGINELVGLTAEVIGIVLSLGIAGAINRFYYDKEIENPNLVVSSTFVGVPVLGFIVLGVLSIFSRELAGWILEGRDQWIYIFLALCTLWFNQTFHLVYAYLRVRERSVTYVILSLAKLVIALSLNIYFIVILEWGVLGLFVANLITAGVFCVSVFPWYLREVGNKFSFQIVKKMLRFTLPIIPANLASLVVNASDRYFIRAFFSLSDVGVYTLGYKLGNVVFYLVRAPFMQIWDPRRYALYKQDAPVELYARIATYFTGLMIFVGLGISIFVQDLIQIISPQEYWGAAVYVPAVALCYVIYALDHHVAFGILIKNRTEYWTYVNLSMGALNLALNFVLIKKMGIWGAVLATFFSLVFKIAALHLIARKLLFIPFEWLRMGSILTLAMLVYFVSVFIHPSTFILSMFYDSAMALSFLCLLWITGIIQRDEKESALKVIKGLFGRKNIGTLQV